MAGPAILFPGSYSAEAEREDLFQGLAEMEAARIQVLEEPLLREAAEEEAEEAASMEQMARMALLWEAAPGEMAVSEEAEEAPAL